jgi:AraC family transcriptional regulator of adaptative response/methylated-DNA-[protein]-cysteine methyltransferase
MYNASFNKDASFEGVFWMGVKTTGIFLQTNLYCQKTKTRKCKFFSNTKDAILKGYRPCKVCKPLEKLNETPKYIQEIIDELVENPSLKFKDYDLVKRGIEPAK